MSIRGKEALERWRAEQEDAKRCNARELELERREREPLRYCWRCEQRRRGTKADPSRCSHCETPFRSGTT